MRIWTLAFGWGGGPALAMRACTAVPGNAPRGDAVRDQSARAAGAVGVGTRLTVPGSAASLRPQGPRDQWLRAGPTPSCPPGRSSARTAPSSDEGGAYTVVGGCGGVGAGSPIWGRQVWCGELLWGYVVGLRFLLGAGESIPFLPKFLLFTSL